MNAPTDFLQTSQLLAIERLVRIVRDSPSDREARMAAVALLAIKPSETPAVAAVVPLPPLDAPGPPPPSPLTPDELQSLRRRLPHMRPERFTRKSPSYWRSMLTEHTHHPLRQAG